jgi:MFS family permease
MLRRLSPSAPDRIAVSGLFFLNGFVAGSWSPKIPEFSHRLGLGEGLLGWLLVAFGVGAMLAMPMTGFGMGRMGSRRMALWPAAFACWVLLALTLVPTPLVAALVLLISGAVLGMMDVAMNANAVAVERRLARPILSSCHGFWSLGTMIGALSGAWLLVHAGLLWHALIVGAVTSVILLNVWPFVLVDPKAEAVHALEEQTGHAAPSKPVAQRGWRALIASPLPYLLGVVALFSMVPEGAIFEWSNFYLRQAFSAEPQTAALGFVGFAAAMAALRFLGDAVRTRLGGVRTLRLSAALALGGLGLASLAPNAWLAILGFGLTGIGLANLVPLAFAASENLPGLPQGLGLSIVGFAAYGGLLAAPPLIGMIGEQAGFAPVFLGLTVFMALVLLLGGLARYADSQVSND